MRLAGLLVLAGMAFGQADTRPRFEAASVKPAEANSRTRWTFPPGQVVLTHTRMHDLIPLAYGLQPFQISGEPAWFASEFYDIAGKLAVTGGAPPEKSDTLAALQVLLEDQFRLKIRRQSKDLALYKLTLAKEGFKIKEGGELPDDTPAGFEGRTASRIVRKKQPIANLAMSLSAYLQCPVEDQTGLTGLYSYVLEWQHDADGSDYLMFTALHRQLGLHLEKGKGPVETLAIESAERPAAN